MEWVVFFTFLLSGSTATVMIVSQNGEIYYNKKENSLWITSRINGNSIPTYVNIYKESSNVYLLNVKLCKSITDNIKVLNVTCDDVNKEYSVDVPVSYLQSGQIWAASAIINSVNTPLSDNVTVLSIVPVMNVSISVDDSLPITIDVGKQHTFSCKSEPYCRPKVELQWLWFNGGKIVQGVGEPFHKNDVDQTLTTTELNLTYTADKNDNGKEISCQGKQITNILNSTERPILNIRYPPSDTPILLKDPVGPVNANTTVNLTCIINGGNPLATLVWTCDAKLVNSSNFYTPTAAVSILLLEAKSTYDNKNCTCTATHPVNNFSVTNSTIMHVRYPPTEIPIIQSSPKGDVIEGDQVCLTCTVAGGNPLATLKWNCSGTVNNYTYGNLTVSTINITLGRNDNKKVCTCLATHHVTTYSHAVSHVLVVLYAPDTNLAIEQNPSLGYVDNGTNITLTCIASGGNPLANLSWNCIGALNNNITEITVRHSVTFTVTPLDNGKVCACYGNHPVNTYKPNATSSLNVFYAPVKPNLTMIPELPWFTGNLTTIRCNFIDGNPQSSVRWFNNSVQIFDVISTDYRFNSLNNENNADAFECEVYNNYTLRYNITVKSFTQHLNVEYFPEVHLDVKDSVNTTEGQSVNLSCSVYGNPLPAAFWIFNKTKISQRSQNKSELVLNDVDRSANGTYTCEATAQSVKHGSLNNNKSIAIIVYYAPDVNVIKTDGYPEEHYDAVLLCNATGYPANYVYTGWQHSLNGIKIREKQSLQVSENGKKLNLPSLSFMDIGNYSCYVNNGIKNKKGILTQNATTLLKIKVAPLQLNLMPVDNTYAAVRGANISVEIDFITEPDIISGEWYNTSSNSTISAIAVNGTTATYFKHVVEATLYGTKVNISEHVYRAKLLFTDFQENMQGYYSFVANNGYKNTNFTVRAVISDKPDPPDHIRILSTTHTGITIEWTRGYNGGHQQTFNFIYFQPVSDSQRYYKSVSDNNNKSQLLTIFDLEPGTMYVFHMFAFNIVGNSSCQIFNATTQFVLKETTENFQVSAVIGGVCAAIVILVISGVIIYVKRRFNMKGTDELEGRRNLTVVGKCDNDLDVDGLHDNILYESAGPMFKGKPEISLLESSSVPKKENKLPVKNGQKVQEIALYAVSQKKSKQQPSESETVKKNGKRHKHEQDDVYENVEGEVGNGLSVAQPKCNRNKDGLQYADLVFNPLSSGPKFIIHGIDDRTIYAQVDTTQQIDPLPDSDCEDTNSIGKI